MSHGSSEKIVTAPVIPAVAAIPPVTGQAPATPGSSLTVALTDAVGGRGQDLSFSSWSHRVPGIEPCDGWTLHQYDEGDSDGFITTGYFASDGTRDKFLNHARFWFDPTQDRFDFLVRSGFPEFNCVGPFTNEDVDVAIVQARAAAQARLGLIAAQSLAIAMVLA